jgi:hypothetical protein
VLPMQKKKKKKSPEIRQTKMCRWIRLSVSCIARIFQREAWCLLIKQIFNSYSVNVDVLYTIYCNMGRFTLIIHEADYKKRKLS